MQTNIVNEKIKVGAVFDGSKVLPKWFYWKKDKHIIQKVEHTWRGRQGEAVLLYFAVTDGVNLFEICLDQKKLEWVLEKVYQEG